jgi:hypothetical protein
VVILLLLFSFATLGIALETVVAFAKVSRGSIGSLPGRELKMGDNDN